MVATHTNRPAGGGRIYIVLVIAAGLAVIGSSLSDVMANPPGLEWLVLAALTLFTGSFTVKLPSLSARISVSETFVFTSVLLFGPTTGTLTVVLDVLVISFWTNSQKRHPLRLLFNVTASAIAIRAASDVFFRLSGAHAGAIGRNDVGHLIVPVFSFALLYFLINTALVTGALAAERGGNLFRIWIRHFPGVSINYFVGSSIAMLIVTYTNRLDVTVLGIILPLLVISYLTFRTSMGRLDDANRHLAQIRELYLSTIETLAMAVDAKDQITHGHIRRVQVYAVELARRLGIKDPDHLMAVETAALLHDMGKLAIPEYILNKPGKLTPAEFENMKRHADIGADLLSSIRFPYPVVPVVRHHHEHWDGRGYPAGVSGTDIPLGARILAVVDCFDALTSDRPYRPRLTTDDAFLVLRERRGTVYDPLIVDTFISSYPEIAPAAVRAGDLAKSIVDGMAMPTDDDRSLRQIRANAAESVALSEFGRLSVGVHGEGELLQHASRCLRQLIPATVFCLYFYDSVSDAIECRYSVGDPSGLLVGLTIRLGEKVSGWSAANKRTSLNSDASLELGQLVGSFTPPLRSCISTPITKGDRLLGVLTAYSPQRDAFSEGHRYSVEQVATLMATSIAAKLDVKSNSLVSFPSRGH
jgi:putative nucleotidyltransferase with HDIG domain